MSASFVFLYIYMVIPIGTQQLGDIVGLRLCRYRSRGGRLFGSLVLLLGFSAMA